MEKGDDDSIHDLRVAIRRFTRCLRTFSAFFPKTAVRKIKTALSAVMDTAGTVRDRDITGDLLKDLGVEKSDLLIQQLRAEREVRRVRLLRALHKFQHEDN